MKVKKNLKRKRAEQQEETALVAPLPPVRQSDEPVEKKVFAWFSKLLQFSSLLHHIWSVFSSYLGASSNFSIIFRENGQTNKEFWFSRQEV